MNIFALHSCPRQSARWLCDQHLNKMLVESAQMIANCFEPEVLEQAPKSQKGNTRKHSYYNHPCSKWVRKNANNLLWLLHHADEIENERLARGFNPHFSKDFIDWAFAFMHLSPTCWIKSDTTSTFAIAISEDMNCRKVPEFEERDEVWKYRYYYSLDKPFARWSRNRPDQWIDGIQSRYKNYF